MQLKNVGRPMERNKRSEIDIPYSIARDEIYLYFEVGSAKYQALVNDEIYNGECCNFNKFEVELKEALYEKQLSRRGDNRNKSYRCIIYTNNIKRAMLLMYPEEVVIEQENIARDGVIYRYVDKHCPIILKNISPLITDWDEVKEAEGVYKLKTVLEFVKDLTNKKSIHQVKCTVGSNIESMEGIFINGERRNNKYLKENKFHFPRLFDKKQMNKAPYGVLVRNYNLLQCANMAGLINLKKEDTYKVLDNVVSFDIKSAYLSTLLTECIFPKELKVIDIDKGKTNYLGEYIEYEPEEVVDNLFRRIDRWEKYNQWYYITIDPNLCDTYSEGSPNYEEAKYILDYLKYFRRGWSDKPDIELKYVNQTEVLCFTKWDIEFYKMTGQKACHTSLRDLLYNLLELCPNYNIVVMYSSCQMSYLPLKFRQEKYKLYKEKESYPKGKWQRDILKLFTELTYGKGLQLREFEDNNEVKQHIYRETVNIAMSITCCAFIRLRIIKDWYGFAQLYNDTDSAKFQFDLYTQSLSDIMVRFNELNESQVRKLKISGLVKDSELNSCDLGKWIYEGIWDKVIFLQKKCYISYKKDNTHEVKLAGCERKAHKEFFKNKPISFLYQIQNDKRLEIPNGTKVRTVVSNEGFAGQYEYHEYSNTIYEKDS